MEKEEEINVQAAAAEKAINTATKKNFDIEISV